MTVYATRLNLLIGDGPIFFDGSFLNKGGGIARESHSMYNALSSRANVISYAKQNLDMESRISIKQSTRMMNFKAACFGFASQYPREVDSMIIQPQVMPIGPRTNQKIFVRLHDIFPLTNPEWFPIRQRLLFKNSFQYSHNDVFFLCDSYYSQEMLVKYFPQYRNRSEVLYCNTEIMKSVVTCGSCEGCSFNFEKKFFISVGTIEPRKNYDYLIEEFPKEWTHELVIVGRYGWKSHKSFARNLRNVTWLQAVCDGSLRRLYQNAAGFISTSQDEGFNLPAFEARKFDLPLVLSNIPVHRELHSDSAAFFDLQEGQLRTALSGF
jgi:glycosyltransferase involved in cell wall biosynthesis